MFICTVSVSIFIPVSEFQLTEFDRKAGRELHLNKLPEFIKVLEGCNHLQNIQQAEKQTIPQQNCNKHSYTQLSVTQLCLLLNRLDEKTHDSMPRGKSWLIAMVALKFFLLSLQTSSLPRWGALWGDGHVDLTLPLFVHTVRLLIK